MWLFDCVVKEKKDEFLHLKPRSIELLESTICGQCVENKWFGGSFNRWLFFFSISFKSIRNHRLLDHGSWKIPMICLLLKRVSISRRYKVNEINCRFAGCNCWWIKKLEFDSVWLAVHGCMLLAALHCISIWHSIPKTHETEQLHTCKSCSRSRCYTNYRSGILAVIGMRWIQRRWLIPHCRWSTRATQKPIKRA